MDQRTDRAPPPDQGDPGHLLHRPVHGRSGRGHRQRGPAPDARQPRPLGGRPAVGGERLHAHLRRLPDAGWPGCRPLRPPPRLHDRPRVFTVCSLIGGLAQSGSWLIAARAAQGIGGAILGSRHLEHPGDHLHGPRRAPAGPRRLVGHGGQRGRSRCAGRRRADQPPQLALGALRQRADRHRPDGRRVDGSAAERGGRSQAGPRHPRGGHRHRRPGRPGLRHREHRRRTRGDRCRPS